MDYVKLRNIKKILKEVNSWKDDMARLTDRQLQEKTVEFRERLAEGETLDDLLPEAFAVAREADKRVLACFLMTCKSWEGLSSTKAMSLK